jgi:hypothetical protein
MIWQIKAAIAAGVFVFGSYCGYHFARIAYEVDLASYSERENVALRKAAEAEKKVIETMKADQAAYQQSQEAHNANVKKIQDDYNLAVVRVRNEYARRLRDGAAANSPSSGVPSSPSPSTGTDAAAEAPRLPERVERILDSARSAEQCEAQLIELQEWVKSTSKQTTPGP